MCIVSVSTKNRKISKCGFNVERVKIEKKTTNLVNNPILSISTVQMIYGKMKQKIYTKKLVKPNVTVKKLSRKTSAI